MGKKGSRTARKCELRRCFDGYGEPARELQSLRMVISKFTRQAEVLKMYESRNRATDCFYD